MNRFNQSFIAGENVPALLPLGRFLPPVPAGMVRSWLSGHVPAGSWIIDPFGSTPTVPLEAARAGYRILVACNNPILSFMLEILATAPRKSDFLATLAELSSSRRGEERLEQYLARMYLTECENCGQSIQAQAFIWHRDDKIPSARLYHCQHCGDQGERPVTDKDIENLKLIGKDTLHRSRAIERVRIGDGPIEPAAEEAIQAYLPRSLDFLFTIINKIEGLPITKERRRLLTALALSACDEGSALWSWPNVRSRPKQLSIPPQFRENNLWRAFENAIDCWTTQESPVALTTWPELPPPSGGICLIPGRINSIGALPETIKPAAAVSALPRPNQAFWTLCAVWAGWIWGKEATLPLRKALERRRYDWNWHAAALHITLAHLYQYVPPEFPFFSIISELSPGFLSAAITGSEAAGFKLDSISILEDEEQAQLHCQSHSPDQTEKNDQETIPSIIKDSVCETLVELNQPATYTTLLAASLTGLSRENRLSDRRPSMEEDLLNRVQQPFERVLNDSTFLSRYGNKSHSGEGGSWWLRYPPPITILPLADRVEMEVVRCLQKNPGSTLQGIQSAMYPLFPGLQTPPTGLILACLESYGEHNPSEPGKWHLRPSETAVQRRKDISEMVQIIKELGNLFQYSCQGEETLEWIDRQGNIAFRFYVFASSIISRFVEKSPLQKAAHQVLVIPGSRSNLLAYKIKENPRLEEAVRTGWHFLKYRHLRMIREQAGLTPVLFADLLDQDLPLWEEPKQMAFF